MPVPVSILFPLPRRLLVEINGQADWDEVVNVTFTNVSPFPEEYYSYYCTTCYVMTFVAEPRRMCVKCNNPVECKVRQVVDLTKDGRDSWPETLDDLEDNKNEQ